MTIGSNFDGSGWYDDPQTASTGADGGNNVNGGQNVPLTFHPNIGRHAIKYFMVP